MRLIWKLLLVLVVIGLAAAGAGYFGIARVNQPYKGYPDAEVFVEIPPGVGPARSVSNWSTRASFRMS